MTAFRHPDHIKGEEIMTGSRKFTKRPVLIDAWQIPTCKPAIFEATYDEA